MKEFLEFSDNIMTNISEELKLFTCTEYTKDEEEEILKLGGKTMEKCSLVCLYDNVSRMSS